VKFQDIGWEFVDPEVRTLSSRLGVDF